MESLFKCKKIINCNFFFFFNTTLKFETTINCLLDLIVLQLTQHIQAPMGVLTHFSDRIAE